MADLLSPADIERLARAKGMTLRDICAAAGIAYSTFGRWKRGETSPTLDVYRRLVAAVSDAGSTGPQSPAPKAAA
jgi:transcriptional regulator with XRE-family HTH domain